MACDLPHTYKKTNNINMYKLVTNFRKKNQQIKFLIDKIS